MYASPQLRWLFVLFLLALRVRCRLHGLLPLRTFACNHCCCAWLSLWPTNVALADSYRPVTATDCDCDRRWHHAWCRCRSSPLLYYRESLAIASMAVAVADHAYACNAHARFARRVSSATTQSYLGLGGPLRIRSLAMLRVLCAVAIGRTLIGASRYCWVRDGQCLAADVRVPRCGARADSCAAVAAKELLNAGIYVRDCIYFIALGYLRVGEAKRAQRYLEQLLVHEPQNAQARRLYAKVEQAVAHGTSCRLPPLDRGGTTDPPDHPVALQTALLAT